jgi:NTP pyrophosphatase (non-canonical NTP hydrolase)
MSEAPKLLAFQDRVQPWMMACFGAEISADTLERGDRLVEEVFETLQAAKYPRERLAALESYVWARPVGELPQEVGGVMVTLAAFCLAHGIDMHAAGETELARIWTKVEKIRAKQAAKPVGSALPMTVPPLEQSEPKPVEGDRAETVTENPKSWIAWKREADDLRRKLDEAIRERDLWKGRCEDSCEAMDRAISDMLERDHG